MKQSWGADAWVAVAAFVVAKRPNTDWAVARHIEAGAASSLVRARIAAANASGPYAETFASFALEPGYLQQTNQAAVVAVASVLCVEARLCLVHLLYIRQRFAGVGSLLQQLGAE